MSRVLKCPELTCSRRESHIYTRSLYSHRRMMARDAEVMEGERASDGRALLWVVLWQCLSWLLCGVRTKQSASILPQKLVTLGGPSIRPRSRTQLPTRTLSLERDKKREPQSVLPYYQASLPIHSSNCECELLFSSLPLDHVQRLISWAFQVKDWFMVTVSLVILSMMLLS